MTASSSCEMAKQEDGKQSSEKRERMKHFSDEITSLDSWSDACSTPGRNSPAQGADSFCVISENDHPHSTTNRYSGSTDTLILNPIKLLTKNSYDSAKENSKLLLTSQANQPTYGHVTGRKAHKFASFLYPQETGQAYGINESRDRISQYRTSNHAPRRNSSSKLLLDHSQQTNRGHIIDKKIFTPDKTNMPSVSKEMPAQKNLKQDSSSSSNISDFGSDPLLEQGEKVKTKLLSVWNNVRYGWALKMKTSFKFDSPIFLLGKCYHCRPDDDEPSAGHCTHKPPMIELFKQDFASRLWFTYRRDFPQLTGSKFTTDCGWGCMLRTGQMMLAQALIVHFLGKDWSVFLEQSREMNAYHHQIIRWFGDCLNDQNPFSVHRLVEIGQNYGKEPGDWFGPASVASILKEAMERGYKTQPALTDVCVYVAQDCTVYKEEVYQMVTRRPKSTTKLTNSIESVEVFSEETKNMPWQRAVVIFIPVRLGGEELNPVYIPCVQSLLAQDCCIGIMGGKPKHSLYFVGWQDSKLVYIDPHYCQDAINTEERDFPIQTFHCLSPRKMSFSKMDPSCTIGFYCRTKEEFDKFVRQTEEMVAPPKQRGSYPMFVFSDGLSSDVHMNDHNIEDEKYLRIRHMRRDQYGNMRSHTLDSEDFVILGS